MIDVLSPIDIDVPSSPDSDFSHSPVSFSTFTGSIIPIKVIIFE